MPRSVDVLDRISRSSDAVFAFDANDLVILWNKGCEALLGYPAYEVLGKRCYDIMCGRDVFGNMYCCRSCPVADQARHRSEEPVQQFQLDVATAGGGRRRLAITTFAIPAGKSAPTTLVHVLREPGAKASPLERELEDAVMDPGQHPAAPRALPGGIAQLTVREREILRALAQGLATSKIAEQMFISPVTVRNHIARILSKLEVHTKLAAVAFAYRHGLVASTGPASAPLPLLRRASKPGSKARKS